MNPKDEGFLSDRFGICVICSTPFEQGDRIATAPAKYFRTSRTGSTIRLGHLSPCVLNARKDGPPDAPPAEARPSVARPESVPCDACGNFYATVDLVLRRTGQTYRSVCPQCAVHALVDDTPNLDDHARELGAPSITRVAEAA